MKKTIIVCDYYPLPENSGGFIRTMNFARFFKKYGTVDIAYPDEDCGIKPGQSIFSNKYLLGRTDYPLNLINRIGAVLTGRPYPIRAYNDYAKRLFISVLERNEYDYILVRYIANTYDLFELPKKIRSKIIIDFDDLFSDSLYKSRFYKTRNPFRKILRGINRRLLASYEKKCTSINVSLFCSEKDRSKALVDYENGFVVPNIYPLQKKFEDTDFDNGHENGKILLFVGMLGYEPNLRGLKWFVESVFQKFIIEHHDAKLMVVGYLANSSGEYVKSICRSVNNVELYTNVPDVTDYYKRCMAVVVPILSGGGTRIKILEAALARRPILSTPVGAEGLDLVDGEHLCLFNNSEQFSYQFNQLLDRQRYSLMTNEAKRIVKNNYTEKNFEIAMQKALRRIDEHR
jgi:glycosyltransferase involved in cell wall biosynthesis